MDRPSDRASGTGLHRATEAETTSHRNLLVENLNGFAWPQILWTQYPSVPWITDIELIRRNSHMSKLVNRILDSIVVHVVLEQPR